MYTKKTQIRGSGGVRHCTLGGGLRAAMGACCSRGQCPTHSHSAFILKHRTVYYQHTQIYQRGFLFNPKNLEFLCTEQVRISKRSSQLRDRIRVSWIGRRILYRWGTREALKGALKDIYVLWINKFKHGVFLLKKAIHNMLNSFSLRRPFQIILARSVSALLSLNVMFRKDHERGSPGAYLSFSTQLVPWLWQVTQLTFLSLSFPHL